MKRLGLLTLPRALLGVLALIIMVAGSAGTGPEAPTVSSDESPSSGEAAPATVKDAGEAEVGSVEPADPAGTDKGAGAGSDKKAGALKDSVGGLPTGVVEEPEGTEKTGPPASP